MHRDIYVRIFCCTWLCVHVYIHVPMFFHVPLYMQGYALCIFSCACKLINLANIYNCNNKFVTLKITSLFNYQIINNIEFYVCQVQLIFYIYKYIPLMSCVVKLHYCLVRVLVHMHYCLVRVLVHIQYCLVRVRKH